MPDTHADTYSIVATVCYGHNNCVDMVELCGGEGGISELAFSMGSLLRRQLRQDHMRRPGRSLGAASCRPLLRSMP
eukprot:8354021-Pyramimonas_sp.AAC.1